MPAKLRLAAVATAAMATLAAAGCSTGSGADGATKACGPVKREVFDTRSLQHVLPNAPTPTYLTNPPTSGPHEPAPPVSGVQHHTLPKPVQVGILEGGNVIVQYRGLDAAQVRQLATLQGSKTVVAPNNDLKTGQVVATAWLYKQTCSTLDIGAMRAFVAQRANHGPDHPNG